MRSKTRTNFESTILQQQFNSVGRVEHGSVALPGILRSGSVGPETLNMGTMPSPQQHITTGQMHLGHMPPLSAAQQALVGTINTSMQAVQQAQSDLEEVEELPPLGDDMASKMWIQNKMDESKHDIHSQVDAITAGTASVVNLTAGDPTDTDYTAVGCAITTISSNLTEMSKGVKLLAALMEDEVGSGQDLMRAAKTLTGAVSDLLKAVEPTSGEPRQTVLTAAGSIGQASGDLLRQIGENETDERFQDVLMNLAKAVANAAAMMVLKAKNVAQVSEDSILQNRVIAAATQCALSTSQLVACAKVVSPTISSPVCQEQLIEAGKLVDRSVEGCVKACLSATSDGELLKAVSAAAGIVTQALSDLLTHVRNYSTRGEPIGRYDQATDTIMTVTESIFCNMGDAGEMVRQARVLAQATSDLVNAMRSDAEVEVDVNNSKKLLAAAKLLADATARMVEAAKGAAAYPENEDQQQKLREAAEGLRVATNAAAQNAIKKKLITRLENAAKQAAAAATQTIAASQNAAASNKNTAAHQQLVQSCRAVADHIPQLVQGVRGSQGQPEDISAQLALIIASQNFLQPGSKMVSSAKSSVPTVMDQAAAMQLGQCAKNLATCLAELRTAAQTAHEACGPMEIDSALIAVQTLKNELQDAKMAASEGQLKPLPGESLGKCTQELGGTSKAVGSSMAQLLTCAAQGNEHYTGVAASETAQALKTLAQAARGVAATTSDPAGAAAMLDSACEVMEGSVKLISEAKEALVAPGNAEIQQRLAQVAKAVSHSLNACVNCLPGQKDVDMALKSIGEASKKLLVEMLPPCSKTFQEAQSDLNQTAADLNQSAGDVVHASRGTTCQLSDASGKFSEDFDEFLDAGIEMAGHTQSKDDQIHVIGNLKNISMASSKLLLAAKSLSVDPAAGNAKNLLAAAARTVTDSINQLITLCTQNAPGQRECDNALRELEAVRGLLDSPNEPANALSYFDCIESVMENSKTLTESTLQMLYAAKEGGGNPKAAHTHDAIAEAAQLMREAVDDLLLTLNEAASEVGIVSGMVDSIADAMGKLGEGTPPEPEGSFVEYQTTMVRYSKAIAVSAQEMITKSVSAPEDLGSLASQITADYSQLAVQGRLAAYIAEPEEIGFQIKTRVQELGHGCIVLVQKAGALQISPSDSFTKRELIECARTVTEKVSMVLSALQAGNKGTQACITAASAVSGIIADLDTTIMFASAGTLNAENDSDSFADHRENILKTAKALVEDTKNLVSGAASSQEKLAQAAQSSAKTIIHLTDVVKLGAASIGADDPETQVVLINAVKDVAKALADLISATKCAAGKAADDPSIFQLKNAAKVMVTNVTSLLKTVKAVEDEASRGTRALEATIECIKQELTLFQSKEAPEKSTTPEEFIRMTKGITTATAKAVAAGNSARQEDVISTANLSRKVIADMLTTCKQAAYHEEVNQEVRNRALLYGTECTNGYIELLEHVLQVLQKPTGDQKQKLVMFSKKVAAAVTELIQTAEAMKGTEWVDPEDPTVIAETELLGAAASIEAAAKKLEQLKPRAKPKQADESLDFEEQILEAAKSIAAATSALVKSASAAQRELVAQGKVGAIPANAVDDGQWSQGLISAARMVAAATSNLCEAANASVQGHASEEKLISSAKQVAASTAQLLVACKVKAEQDSEAMRRLQVIHGIFLELLMCHLQAAGNAVKRASDSLVRAAQKAAFNKADDDNVVVKTRFVGGIAQIIAAQEEMLRKERELEEARKKLAQIRQQQYKFLPSELREDED
uniref:Talin-2 n=1 Tax=Sinocyclocheilus grahami TaxID=75366 RepID=A0A672MXU2_SINGR